MDSVQKTRVFVSFLLAVVATGLSACSSIEASSRFIASTPRNVSHKDLDDVANYGAITDEKFPIHAINASTIAERNLRQFVDFETDEHPGTIVIDTDSRFLYLVQDHHKAIRYGIGVGVNGLAFTGNAVVGYKREWPRWTPTANMIRRNPSLNAKWKRGMDGGPSNPLGARALYLFKDGTDTLFRIHGTSEPNTIGKAVSSGCIRMFNHDIIDLHRRVPPGTRVVVMERRVEAIRPVP